ncbi:hypothetical protein MMC20_003507 [Loxospora ochrophaea]|nr:hypothetical protein [Loxospora ochrophaea]
MASLLDLLCNYPVLVSLASSLDLAALLNLSRANVCYRAVLHRFPLDDLNHTYDESTNTRLGLRISQHQTPLWRHLKSLAAQICGEPCHTRDGRTQGCRMCSIPVCEPCIVKQSMAKSLAKGDNTFLTRWRNMCDQCWLRGVPPREGPVTTAGTCKPVNYRRAGLCTCTSFDGWLCSGCKKEQTSNLDAQLRRCAGRGCSTATDGGSPSNRICRWCNLPLPALPSLEWSRRAYESRCANRVGISPFEDHTPFSAPSHRGLHKQANGKSYPLGDDTRAEKFKRRLSSFGVEKVSAALKKKKYSRLWTQQHPADDTRAGAQTPLESEVASSAADCSLQRRVLRSGFLPNLAMVEYKDLGALAPRPKNVRDSFRGVFRYELDFLLVFQPLCNKEPRNDWWPHLAKTMAGENPPTQDSETSGDSSDDTDESWEDVKSCTDWAESSLSGTKSQSTDEDVVDDGFILLQRNESNE